VVANSDSASQIIENEYIRQSQRDQEEPNENPHLSSREDIIAHIDQQMNGLQLLEARRPSLSERVNEPDFRDNLN